MEVFKPGIIVFFQFIMICPFITANGSSGKKEESRDYPIDGVEVLNFRLYGNAEISIGSEEKLTITTDESFFKFISVKQESDTLTIKRTQKLSLRSPKIKYEITLRSLREVKSSGSVDINLPEPVVTPKLVFAISGSGNITAKEITTEELTVGISGSGDFTAETAEAKETAFNISGSGSFNAGLFSAEVLTSQLKGSGDFAVETAEAKEAAFNISGSGSFNAGLFSAEVLTSQLKGSGDVVIDGGDVVQQKVSISGSGDYKNKASGSNGEISIKGSGNVDINLDTEVSISILGSGNIRLSGSPKIQRLNILGSGKVMNQ